MTTHSVRHAILSETATFDAKTGELRVVIETPKGSRNKYDYDPDCDCLELATVLPEGMSFPYDFGFVPSTLGEDGDPLDILVLMDAPVVPGCVIRARPIGAIEAKQKAKGDDWQRNDRLIAVAAHAQAHQNVQSLKDLRPHLVDEIKEFFIVYNRLRGRKFKPLVLASPDKSRELIESGMDAFEKQAHRGTGKGKHGP
jgi:inorganic pyrophosphatase